MREPYGEGPRIKEAMALPGSFVVAYANGGVGYLPSRRAEAADGKNGSALNLPLSPGISPFDSRAPGGRGKGYETIRAKLPIRMKPGDALLSSISAEPRSLPAWLRPSDKHHSPVGTVSVLTCLKERVPPDAFRPSYCDRGQKLYLARHLRRELLPQLSREGIPFEYEQGKFTLGEFADHFERPWLEICFFHFDAPAEYQVQYGREAGQPGRELPPVLHQPRLGGTGPGPPHPPRGGGLGPRRLPRLCGPVDGRGRQPTHRGDQEGPRKRLLGGLGAPAAGVGPIRERDVGEIPPQPAACAPGRGREMKSEKEEHE